MRGRALATALAWLGLTALQAPPPPPAPAQISLWRLDCGEFVINDYAAFFSDTFQYPPGPKRITDSCYLIRHGDRYMLWDTGLPGEMAGQTMETPAQTLSLRERIVDQLARINVRPDQIEFIGISHHHLDHIGQAADFPRARLVIGAGDVQVLRTETGPFIQPQRIQPWLDGQREMLEARGDVDIFHDGRVVMLSTPGHTPGHYALLVRLASPRVIIQHEPADIGRLPAFPEAAR